MIAGQHLGNGAPHQDVHPSCPSIQSCWTTSLGGRGVGVGGGGIPRVRHQGGQSTLSTGAENLVARDRCRVLRGSVPTQGDPSTAVLSGKPAGGRWCRVRQLDHSLVGDLALFPVADGLHPVGVALSRGVGGFVGVDGGVAARVRHQDGQLILSPGPQHLVARNRTGVLGGSVPAQDYLPVHQLRCQVGRGELSRVGSRRCLDPQRLGLLALPLGVDGPDMVEVFGLRLNRGVGVARFRRARVRRDGDEPRRVADERPTLHRVAGDAVVLGIVPGQRY